MGKVCPRCSYERKETDQAPITDCPQCGVIYDRFESGITASRAAINARTVSMRRASGESAHNLGGLLNFHWLVVPALVRISFALSVVILSVAFVLTLLGNDAWFAAALLGCIVVSRILHESIIVVFRLADDVRDIRQLLLDQATNVHTPPPQARP